MFTDIETLLYVLFIGVLFAACYAYYQKKFIGGFVRRLNSKGALDVNSALSFTELGYKNNSIRLRILKKELKGKYGLSRHIGCVDERFYLPCDTKDIVLNRYDDKGTNVISIIIGIILSLFIISFAVKVIPSLSDFAKQVPGSFKGVSGDMSGYTEDANSDVNSITAGSEV